MKGNSPSQLIHQTDISKMATKFDYDPGKNSEVSIVHPRDRAYSTVDILNSSDSQVKLGRSWQYGHSAMQAHL